MTTATLELGIFGTLRSLPLLLAFSGVLAKPSQRDLEEGTPSSGSACQLVGQSKLFSENSYAAVASLREAGNLAADRKAKKEKSHEGY